MQMEPHELIKAIVAGVGERLKAENETLKTVLMEGLKQLEKRVAQLEEDNEFLPHSH